MFPLTWPDNWANGMPVSRWKRLFLDWPFFGPVSTAQRHICEQLANRPNDTRHLWGDDIDRLYVWKAFDDALAKWYEWPHRNFMPDDPFQIVAWDWNGYHCDNALGDLINDVNAALGPFDSSHWQRWWSLSYGEVVDAVSSLATQRRPTSHAR